MSGSISHRVREALLMAALFGGTQVASMPAPSTDKPSGTPTSPQLTSLEPTRIR